ncbi:MAG TPA: hypothetical protein VHA05_02590 [Candidatus Saccharimonadales bacterium]|jgi:hypothetical protein|nr:hypothetical protein [Candidatus Saccharimonadales bacterium]
MPPDEPTDEEELEELPEDGETPFRPATSTPTDDTHPSTDDGLQPEELYDAGLDVKEPNAGNAVEGYDPSKDSRLKK